VTGSENIRHAFRTNLKSGNGRDGKLSSEQIRQIRTCSDSQKVIAMRYGISRQMVGLIKQRKAYKEVS
jgi:DNA-binding transcriptional regulator YiaG